MRAFVAFASLSIAVLAAAGRAQAEVFLDEKAALAIAFPGCDTIEKRRVLPTPKQRVELESEIGVDRVPRVFTYWRGLSHGESRGYAVIDDVIGKSEPITYMVVADAGGVVRAVEILAYRESHGGEVRDAAWRAQFAGKSAASACRVGTDVRNIAGATISCRSVTDGVRRNVRLLAKLAEEPAGIASPSSAGASIVGSPRVDDLRRARVLMGTTLRLDLRGAAERVEPAAEYAFAEVARLEAILTTWNDTSCASKLNARAGGGFEVVDRELFDCLDLSSRIARETRGAFDPVCGAAVQLWRAAAERGAMPDSDSISRAAESCGARWLELDFDSKRARLADAGARLDFGAIGKGLALESARRMLAQSGVETALLDFGGQILALGRPPDESGWRVEVRDPIDERRACAVLRIANESVSTSADYERGLVIGGERVSHIVDPRTARPAHGLLAATVVAPDAARADALSTALFVLGFDEGARFAHEHQLAALLIGVDGRVARTDAFVARLESGAR